MVNERWTICHSRRSSLSIASICFPWWLIFWYSLSSCAGNHSHGVRFRWIQKELPVSSLYFAILMATWYILSAWNHTGLTYLRYDDYSTYLSDKDNIGTRPLYVRNKSGMNTITECYSDLLNNLQSYNVGHTVRFIFTKIFIVKILQCLRKL